MADKDMVDAVKEESGYFGALAALAESPSGQTMITALSKTISAEIDRICSNYVVAPEMTLRGQIASLNANIVMLKALCRARTNFDMSQEYLKELTAK